MKQAACLAKLIIKICDTRSDSCRDSNIVTYTVDSGVADLPFYILKVTTNLYNYETRVYFLHIFIFFDCR